MLEADEKIIRWLLFESNQSGYRISKETGIAQSQISMLNTGDRDIKKLSFENASKLTDYAKTIKEQ